MPPELDQEKKSKHLCTGDSLELTPLLPFPPSLYVHFRIASSGANGSSGSRRRKKRQKRGGESQGKLITDEDQEKKIRLLEKLHLSFQ